MNKLHSMDRNSMLVCRNSTPVLYFGSIATAEVITVGYNPSASEFVCSECGRTVDRLASFTEGEVESALDQGRMDYILGRMTHYFTHNPYTKWFDRWNGGLAGRDFYKGTAAHTDILSPFATVKSYGRLTPTVQKTLEEFGFPMWLKVMQYAKNAKLIIGIGERSLEKLNSIGDFQGCDDFNHFANASTPEKPWTYTGAVSLADGREIKAVVWIPYLGNPLEWMNVKKREQFGDFCKKVIG